MSDVENGRSGPPRAWVSPLSSLRPSVNGLTTGVVYADVDFELEIDLADSCLNVRTARTRTHREALRGQGAGQLAGVIADVLGAAGADPDGLGLKREDDADFDGYDEEQARRIGRALAGVSSAMHAFRAGILEETSPIQVWPHHFDLSMLWLPGGKIPGQEPADEEHADEQMNFGFTFGDGTIGEPYLYITAYPQPDGMPGIELPGDAVWHDEGFSGVVLRYGQLVDSSEPVARLLHLWRTTMDAVRT